MVYSRFQSSLPTRRDQFKEHNKEQEAVQSFIGLEFGPFLFKKTKAVAAYQYSQEWYTDSSSLIDFIRKPLNASGRLLKNADLLEREHRVYLDSKTSISPNISFLLWMAKSMKLAGSKHLMQEERGLHKANSYLLKDWIQIKPQASWDLDYAHNLRFYFDFFKEYSYLQPEQSYQSYHLETRSPKGSFGINYQYRQAAFNTINLDLFKEHHRLGDPLEDFERTGLVVSNSLRASRELVFNTSLGVFNDLYRHQSLFTSGPNLSVSSRKRKETGSFFSFSNTFSPNIHHRFGFSFYFSRNENKYSRPRTINHLKAQINWTYTFPFNSDSGLKTFREPKKLTSKRIEYHGLR